MANPEQGPQEQGIVGTWQTVSLEVPDFLEPVREAVDAFFSFLIRILDILLAVLELLKVFLTGLLDPLIALIESLRNLIEALLNDLRQLGIYLHGDFYSLEGPDFQALKGGYLAYEGRMVARLQDTSDPNRPNISSFSTCIAVFLFAQSDIRGINRIVQLIRSILALFNRKGRNRLNSSVTNVQATYGYDGATIFSFNKGFFRGIGPRRSVQENLQNPYNAVNLTWQMAPVPGVPFPDTPILPPAGFLVEFSTVEQPIKLVAERVIEGSAQDMELNNQPSKTEVVDVLDEDGNPILLRGGVQQVDVRGAVNWNDAVAGDGEFKSDAVRVYGIKNLSDRAPVPLDLMQDGDKFFLQRTFYVPFGQNLFFPGKGYGATFLFEDMPFDADFDLDTGLLPSRKGRITRSNDDSQPERFFVRVRAVSRDIQSETDYQFVADQTALRDREGPVLPLKNPDTVDLLDAGPPSPVTPILFPDASTELYLRAVAEALAVLVLSRADLPVLISESGEPVDFPPGLGQALADGLINPFWSTYEDHARLSTGLEELAKFLMIQLTGRRQVKKYFNEAGASLPKFRRKLFINCVNLTNRYLTQNLPPLPARQLAVERAEDLLNFQILKSLTGTIITTTDPDFPGELKGGSLLELLRSDDLSFGVSPNPQSLGVKGGRIADSITRSTRDSRVLARDPHFFFVPTQEGDPRGRGSVDMCPVVYNRQGARLRDIDFVRNLIPDSVYEGAQFVLQVAAGPQVRPQERGWIAFRLFPQGIPSIDRFFDQILSLLRAIQAAVESIAETIRRYIEFLQSRIRELQAFLNRLNALIQRLLRFFLSVTPAAGLVVVAPGTEGVTTALIESQNKPITPANPQADSYGGGVVLFAGGIPNLALDVFVALFRGDT